jgi:hypothetical protein
MVKAAGQAGRDATPDDSHMGLVLRVLVTGIGTVVSAVAAVLIMAVWLTLSRQARHSVRCHRQIRRVARRIGALDGQVVINDSGSGVFGEGPYWRDITTFRIGTPGDLLQAQLDRAFSAGYQLEAAAEAGIRCTPSVPASLPELTITVLPEGARLRDGLYWLAHGPGGRPPELVWGPHGETDGPGRANRVGAAVLPRRYATLSPPVVPAGTTGVRISLHAD